MHQVVCDMNIALSVVIPCLNESEGMMELYRRVSAACTTVSDQSYEIVFVNDGSTDDTCKKMISLANEDHRVVVIDLARNYGHQIALSAGLELCRGQRVLILDADLQDPPELLEPMMAKMDEGYDVVYGLRNEREGESWFKLKTAAIFYRLLGKLSEVQIPANVGDFRLMNRCAVDHLNAMPERFRFMRGMISWIGLRQCAFPYKRDMRYSGVTHYPFRKMLVLAIDAVTSFSVAPLRLASHLGFGFGILGIATLLYTVTGWAVGLALPGWTSLASITLILGSVQLLMLGIFGEYLGRMYIESKRRPLYIVKEIISRTATNSSAVSAPAGSESAHV
jgi:dolichol-phosphate mannosyltransferase